ncbi:hypothetical protein RI138_14610 [Streptomyces sp. C11-1]|uniref:Uncharacterized protein n=1 Tax=Streptomyces durocortorensis TaxID=2811104 RepID=A0ABY9VXP8_9ACTN|nr:hypothetical protein [Streptomyces durocortorensis]WNF27959.1 hypothetical protein RI138_14610 [Streptomyces durocortorensis]
MWATSCLGLTRITVTLPSDQVAEAVPGQIRRQLLGDALRRHEEEHGQFSDEEARAKVFGSAASSKGADAA